MSYLEDFSDFILEGTLEKNGIKNKHQLQMIELDYTGEVSDDENSLTEEGEYKELPDQDISLPANFESSFQEELNISGKGEASSNMATASGKELVLLIQCNEILQKQKSAKKIP